MSGLSTKDVKTGGIPKTIGAGEHVLKINGIKLTSFPFMEADKGYYLVLDVETKPIPGFEGFFIDPDDESLGRYAGQIGQVKANKFYYKDGTTKSGIEISRDMEILKQIKNVCLAGDLMDWFDAADGKYETIEAFVEAFNKEKPFKDIYFKFCLGGKEFERKNGYIGIELFFPKSQRGKVVFEKEGTSPSKLLAYDEAEHLTKFQPTEVEDFGNEENSEPGSPDLSKAPDFEL